MIRPLRRAAPLALLELVLLGLALPAAPASAAVRWIVDPAASRLGFTATQGGSQFDGRFTRYDATILFDPADLADSRVEVTIDMASAVTGDRDRDSTLPTRDWFDVAGFPQARFVATRFTHLGGSEYEAMGELMIREVTRPVTLPFTLEIEGDTARVRGRLLLSRTDYGVGQGQWVTPDIVGHEVVVVADLTAHRAE